MNQQDFFDWKRHPVTQAVFSQLQTRIDVLSEEVVEQAAYVTQAELAEKAGAIKAIRDLLRIEYEEETL